MLIDENLKLKLIDVAFNVMKHSYAPYSQFNVGAAALMSSGEIYTGVNVENASYPAGTCAECNAVNSAVGNGEKNLLAIAIVGGMKYSVTDYCSPCGICRQVMSEFSNGGKMVVLLAKSRTEYKEFTLEQLLPNSYHF